VQIRLLELHGRRQDDIRVLHGVRAEVLHHDREEIRSLQSTTDLRSVRYARKRMASVDEARLAVRVTHLQQACAHSQRAGQLMPNNH
jgi:hypothetical protein